MAPSLYQLHDRLFVRGHTRNVDAEAMLTECQIHDIRFVLNVALIPDDFFHAACRCIGITYQHTPMHDARKTDENMVIDLALHVAKKMVNYPVLIHCDSGYNRSALIGVLAAHMITWTPMEELIARAREVRPLVLKNEHFEKFLLEVQLEKDIVKVTAG